MKRQQFGWCVSLAAIAVMILSACPVEAGVQTALKVSSGNWATPTDWDNGVPTSDDDAFIGSTLGDGVTPATCILNTAGQACDRIAIGHYAGNVGQLDITGGDLTVTGAGAPPQVNIADRGTGIVNQSGGTWNNGGKSLNIGIQAGSSGECNLTGGVLTNVASLYIGSGGNGVLNLGGSGALRSSGAWYVGRSDGSTGTVTQTGGTWDMGGQSGYIGDLAGSVGAVTISGGVFTNANSVNAGNYGTGSLTISGGTFNSARLYIATRDGTTGLVSIVGSTASIQTTQFRSEAVGTSAIFRVTPDVGGISTIHVHNDGTSNAGKCYIGSATVEVDFSNYDSTDDLILITADTALIPPAGLTILTAGWSAELAVVGKDVHLVNITMPPRGTIVTIK